MDYIIILNNNTTHGLPRAYWNAVAKDFTILSREASFFADREAALRELDLAARVAPSWGGAGEVELREVEPKKPTVQVHDMTPTWSAVLPILIAGATDTKRDSAARESAMAELRRMAELADKYVALNKGNKHG